MRDAHEVFDTRRRGEPRLGCDCMYCWGQCMIRQDMALRDALGHNDLHVFFPITDEDCTDD